MNRPQILVAALAAAAITLSVSAQELLYAHRLPDGDVRELAKLELPPRPPRTRVHRFLPAFDFRASLTARPQAAGQPGPPTIGAPAIAQFFTSGTSDELDPADAGGAVGRMHVVGSYNSGLVMHDRSGKVLTSVSLPQFWAVSSRIGDQYDPRIAYDAANDRWITTAIDRGRTLLFAVSKTGDPTGEWRRYDARVSEPYVDFTRVAVTRDTVMLMTAAGDAFTNFIGVILSIRKSDLYADVDPLPIRKFVTYDPGLVPVHGETSAVEYVLTHSGYPEISVMRLDSFDQRRLVTAPSWVTRPSPALPQLGGGWLLSGYDHIEAAVFHKGAVYAVFTGGTTMSSSSAAVWCRFDPETLASSWEAVYDPAGKTDYAYPSIAVAENGEVLIGTGIFAPDQHPSAALVWYDLYGRKSATALIRSGAGPFTANDRWGDYTTTVVDPVDKRSFWTVQIATTAKKTWETVWAKVAGAATNRRRSARH